MAACVGTTYAATDFVNLTPTPKAIVQGTGEVTLPQELTITYSSELSTDQVAEISKFAKSLKTSTGINSTITEGTGGFIQVELNSSLADEGYILLVKSTGITIKASTDAGVYYAFQTIKKVLPANVMAEIYAEGTYTLPVMTINDAPRYVHRGYELDCARHFFSVDEIKRMLDVMSYYKMNRFHWHLTDDQGWRFEVPKYPRLISVAATAPNAYWWNFKEGYEYYINKPYGPYYFSVDDMKEVVAYAKERHIEVIPEVDMPGHMQAAIAAYPEFSCTPSGDHPLRYWPGVSTDILDVSNPAVIQFCKDVMDELMEIFPYEYIHIGGDECPTTAWANSTDCQNFKAALGLTSDRALQSWLTKQLADYVKPNGRRLICWNEALTADGADTKLMQEADVMIYDWLGGTASEGPSYQAAKLGLRSVWCSTYHYYIDYSQWSGSSEPKSMGGPITLETIYNVQPSTTSDASLLPYYYGVQCNLWTEYICENEHLEYNSLPRMIAVAETGWSPQSKKDFTSFKQRFNADTKLLDLRGYTYGKHYVDNTSTDVEVVYPTAGAYYRLVTMASADSNRKDRCIELVREGSPLISSNSATVGQLWTNTQVGSDDEAYDWQYWTFEADPSNADRFAMVCKAQPNGSVSPAMSGSTTSAHWSYDASTKHYDFVLGEYYGEQSGSKYYSIRSNSGSTWFINCGQVGANLTVNNWATPDDGNGGLWLFSLEGGEGDDSTVNPAFTFLTRGATYAFYQPDSQLSIADNGGDYPAVAAIDASACWSVETSTEDSALNVQTLTLRNASTGRYLSGVSSSAASSTSGTGFFTGNAGYPVLMGTTGAEVKIISNGDDTYTLSIAGNNLYPLSAESLVNPATISSGSTTAPNAMPEQGTAWALQQMTVYTVEATDTEGTSLGTYTVAAAVGTEPAMPAITNYTAESHTTDGTTIRATYRRSSYSLTVHRSTTDGYSLGDTILAMPVGSAFVMPAMAMDYCTLSSQTPAEGTSITPTADAEATAVFSTEAVIGVSAAAEALTELTDGATLLIYDAHSDRHAFRYADDSNRVYGSNTISGVGPNFIWRSVKSGDGWKFQNMQSGLFIPAVLTSDLGALNSTGCAFLATYNASEQAWHMKNPGSDLYWDGEDSSTGYRMVGWSSGGHPYHFYSYTAALLFSIDVTEQTEDGTVLRTRHATVTPGSAYNFMAGYPGYAIKSVTGAEGLDFITSNKVITVVYVDATSLREITADGAAAAQGIYDLQGRRLQAISRPGIYIVGGQKILVK
jgi:N-acetyl-beta-hexosaminidase